ncbi:MAG TPA: glucokinase [Burkholderiales bacterium]|nr:glucokinase [Burkholderiales bacterium]
MTARTLVLGGDIGGTNTKLALAAPGSGERFREKAVYASADYETLEQAVEAFMRDAAVAPDAIGAACFAVAGPVEHGRATLTNLAWRPDESTLARHFGFPRVSIINDFAAAGLGIAELAPGDLLPLQEGSVDPEGSRVIVGAGTGLGVALLEWDSTYYEVHASEAGHADFAPNDAQQDELLVHLRRDYRHVSYERVLSGRGICRVLSFLEANGAGAPSAALRDALTRGDPAKAITDFALRGADALAVRALDVFVSAYGSFAGNMALTMLAHGGVYIAGGIAPKIAPKLADGTFMRAFVSKGRFRSLLESVPVHVVMNDQVGLLGALSAATRLAG